MLNATFEVLYALFGSSQTSAGAAITLLLLTEQQACRLQSSRPTASTGPHTMICQVWHWTFIALLDHCTY
jgi:hypothetical protein